MAKDFKKKAARPSVYDVLNNATQEEYEALTAQEAPPAQEVQERQEALQTQGKRGAKAQRINMAFTPSNMDFIRTMARIKGQTMTQFVNDLIAQERENNGETYNKLKELLKDFKE